MPTPRRRNRARAAVVDIGSGTVNLAVFARRRDGLALVEEQGAPLRLLASLRDASLAPQALDAAVDTLTGFVARARAIGAEEIEIVGTSALRDPPHDSGEAPRDALDRRLREAVGVGVRVIDGDKEALFAARAVLNTLPVVDAVVADLGGGSLQLAEIRERRVRRVASLPVGALRLLLAHPLPDPPDADTLTAMRRAVDAALASVIWLREAPGVVIGCGGTFRTLARIDRKQRASALAHPHGQRLTADAVESILERAGRATAADRASLPGLPAHRVDVLVPGALVVTRLLHRVRTDEARTASVGIREGVLLGRAPADTDALRARGLRLRFADAPMPHADRRASAVTALLDTTAPGAAEPLRTLVRAAGWLDAAWTLRPPEGGPLAALLGAPVPGFLEEELYALADVLSEVPRGQIAPEDRERVRLLLELARAEVEGDPQLRAGAVRVRIRGHVHADLQPRFRRAFARPLEVIRPDDRVVARA